jgi:hypothetical protein
LTRLLNWLLYPLRERWQAQARENERKHWEPLLQTTKARLSVCEMVARDQTKRMAELKKERDNAMR